MKNDYFRFGEEDEEKVPAVDNGNKPSGWEPGGAKPQKEWKLYLWLVIGLIVIGLALVWHFIIRPQKTPSPAAKPVANVSETSAASQPTPALEESSPTRSVAEARVALNDSDDSIRLDFTDMSSVPLLSDLLKEKNMIRRFVALVDNIARGENPKTLVESMAPKKSFSVIQRGGALYIDRESYRRFDPLVSMFVSLDTERAADQLLRYRSQLEEAYRELGHGAGSFSDTLIAAVNRVLEVPIVESPISVYEKPISFEYMDEKLEKLSDAQKHFLRLGPDNLRKIKQKIHRIMESAGFSQKLQY